MTGTFAAALEDEFAVAPETGWIDYGFNGDDFKARQDKIQRSVIKRASGAPRLSHQRLIDKGGAGTIEIDASDVGMGIFIACAASTAESSVAPGGTLAHEQVFEWTAEGMPEGRSIAVAAYRDRRDGTEDVFDYLGGKGTQLEIGQDNKGFLTLKIPVDFQKTERLDADPERDVEDIEPTFLYAWKDALITLTPKDPDDGDPETECLESFSGILPNGLDVEEWCIKRGTDRHEPTRSTVPEPTGSIAWRYQHPRYYDAFRNGTPFSLTAEWEAPDSIEGSTKPSLTIELTTICFHEANDPESSPTDPTKQTMPFAVYDDETGDPVARITIITADDTDLNLPTGS